MEDDLELAAIRARLRAEMMGAAPSPAPAPTLDHPIEADDATLPRLVQEHRLLVVDCWAPWCGPCRIVGPIIDDLAREMAGRVTFAKLNVDHNPGTSQAFGVRSIPTLLVFRDGRLVDQVVGAMPKAQLAARLQRHAGPARPGPGPRR